MGRMVMAIIVVIIAVLSGIAEGNASVPSLLADYIQSEGKG